ncbi:phosphotransferase enzyme family protein [Aspergillus terreus]|uniref:Altered inheritance of mitochondria protein 9, mitochondrial n=1 Tax=Aspergillus terreus TaxID=33178 RepID=A0A5M3ZAF3_ASPTE|nr:hypothetical protein ATETN484_0010049300 [Aspergillus terreus]GFF18540.1 phosphotransferase enzyme family protein [Aspergillus terreus]
MVNLDFPAYGSLYHAENRAPSRSQRALDNEFCIGPHCGIRYWDCTGGEGRYYDDLEPNRGPWNDIHQYSDGLIDAGLSRLPPSISDGENRPSYHGSVESHKILLEQARIWLKTISTDHRIKASSRPVLYHPDLHTRNIFVSEKDPSVITGIIDWQAASIEPAFWYSDEIPDFATSDEPGDEVYTQAFNMASQFLTPVHFNPRLMDENLFRPFRYSYRTWKDGAVALRHELIETTRNWEKLGFSGQCPLPPPTTEELANHEQEYKLFEAAQNLRRDLSSLLNTATDGWMPPESWETTKLAHKEIFDGMLQAVLANEEVDDDPVKDEATLRSIWPFDID